MSRDHFIRWVVVFVGVVVVVSFVILLKGMGDGKTTLSISPATVAAIETKRPSTSLVTPEAVPVQTPRVLPFATPPKQQTPTPAQ